MASANIEEFDPGVADYPLVTERIDGRKPDTVRSKSFGFGGTNASLLFGRYSPA